MRRVDALADFLLNEMHCEGKLLPRKLPDLPSVCQSPAGRVGARESRGSEREKKTERKPLGTKKSNNERQQLSAPLSKDLPNIRRPAKGFESIIKEEIIEVSIDTSRKHNNQPKASSSASLLPSGIPTAHRLNPADLHLQPLLLRQLAGFLDTSTTKQRTNVPQ